MQLILSIIVIAIFAAILYRPIVKRQQGISDCITRKDRVKAFILGLIPATIIILVAEIALGWLYKLCGLAEDSLPALVIDAFITYAAMEEVIKYAFARLTLKGRATLHRIDIMVVFAAVGLGYETMESLFWGNVISSIARSIFLAHMAFQLIMAHFYCESLKAKSAGDEKKAKRLGVLTLLVPILLHGCNDFYCQLMSFTGFDMDQDTLLFVSLLIVLILQLGCLIAGLRLAKKEPELELTLTR